MSLNYLRFQQKPLGINCTLASICFFDELFFDVRCYSLGCHQDRQKSKDVKYFKMKYGFCIALKTGKSSKQISSEPNYETICRTSFRFE